MHKYIVTITYDGSRPMLSYEYIRYKQMIPIAVALANNQKDRANLLPRGTRILSVQPHPSSTTKTPHEVRYIVKIN